MRIRVLVLILSVLVFAMGIQRVGALHLAAVNITYVGIDTFTYVITIRYYRDCTAGQGAPASVIYSYNSTSCGLSGTAISDLVTGDLTGFSGTGDFIDLPCSGVDTCDAGLGLYSIEEFVYVDTLTLPDTCSDWIISSTTSGNRNPSDVIPNATSEKIYVEALINNVDAPGNSSPDFIKPPVAVFCVNRDFFFNQGAIEGDGDSLVYSLVQAQGLGGVILPYNSPFTAQYPFNTVGNLLTMEPNSGVISFTPDTPAVVSVLSILIEEYNSNGILIGSIKNDMQVIINDSCTSDTLNVVGDTTTPTGVHPAITASCLDLSITLHFSNPIQCETISLDGSDFLILSTGPPVSVVQVLAQPCLGGLADSLVLILSDSLRFNGSYFLYDTIGSDFIPILSECGLRLNDTLEIRLRNCVKASVDLLNVTVVSNSRTELLWTKYTENFQDVYFIRYDIHRSLNPGFGYDSIGSVFDINDTTFTDVNVSVTDTPYNYMVKMVLDPNLLLAPVSDTIQSILLLGTQNLGDTGIMDLLWTRYWGWDDPVYELLESVNNAAWRQLDMNADPITTYAYDKSLLANSYRLMIRSTEAGTNLRTESNWIEITIDIKTIPNIITPNGDGINDFFFINEILLYEPVHLMIFNRWGMMVFEDVKYENNWDGDNFVSKPLVAGTYYYLLKLNGADDRAGFVTIIR
ncbi:MAG: gliding motility-associated C-terminal domain-containing protein [Flavobacteriales bacterium]|nr:gliding motility-associated C-terminal domain-containing protein [Flavobacteriales bacterium]